MNICINFVFQVHQNYHMIVIWVLINGLQEITFKNYEQNSIKDIKIKGKEVLKVPIKK